MKKRNLTVVLLSIVLLIACTTPGLKLTPDQEKDRVYYQRVLDHATAVKKFAQAEAKYNVHYENTDAATKAFLKEKVDPLWIQASDALDAWKAAITGGQSGEDEIMAYKRLKSAILAKLPDLIWSD